MMLMPEEKMFVPAISQSAPTLLLMIAFDTLTPPTIEELFKRLAKNLLLPESQAAISRQS